MAANSEPVNETVVFIEIETPDSCANWFKKLTLLRTLIILKVDNSSFLVLMFF